MSVGAREGLERLSFHQLTAPAWPIAELARGCAEAGVRGVGLFRRNVEADGLDQTERAIRDAGLRVTSYGPVGFFASGVDADGATRDLEDNIRCLDQAAALGAEVVVAVAGPLAGRSADLGAARARIASGLAELLPHAVSRGLRIALEPLHPMLCPERSTVCTLRDALDLVETLPAALVGVSVDVYAVWWDPELPAQLVRAGERVLLAQLSDWPLAGPADRVLGRTMMGEGCIDIAAFVVRLVAAGYRGPFEVEILDRDLAALPGREILRRVIDSYLRIQMPSPTVA
jgi:sugar phosphate isomerase/epimerase